METYTITDKQWQQINHALLAAIGLCGVHAPEMRGQMIKAAIVMDEILDGPDDDEDDEDDAA